MNQTRKLAKKRYLFYLLSFFSVGSLVGSFAYPLQKVEVRQQLERDNFNNQYQKVFILTESDRELPYGYNQKRSTVIAKILQDFKSVKLLLLTTSILSSCLALTMGDETVEDLDILDKVKKVESKSRAELLLQQVKHKAALASQSQTLSNRDEIRELASLFGNLTQDASEVNSSTLTDVFYLVAEGHSIDYAIEQKFQLKQDNPEFQNIKQKYLEEFEQ